MLTESCPIVHRIELSENHSFFESSFIFVYWRINKSVYFIRYFFILSYTAAHRALDQTLVHIKLGCFFDEEKQIVRELVVIAIENKTRRYILKNFFFRP